jgi:hypothetical protein
MAATMINNALAIINCDALVDAVDGGAGAGLCKIYTGSAPAAVETAATGTLLGTLTFSDPAFGAAADQNPGALATANAITDDTSADATGTAGYFRVMDSNLVQLWQGDITATGGGGDMELNSVAISAGAAISITSFTVTVPES